MIKIFFMKYLKYQLNFFINFIYFNKVKFIMLLLAGISFYYAGSFPSVEEEIIVIKQVDLGETFSNRYAYIYEFNENNDIKKGILAFDEKQELVNNKLIRSKYNGINVLFWFFFGIFLIMFIVMSLIDDEDINWYDTPDIRINTLAKYVSVEQEGKHLYYICFGRLIGIRDVGDSISSRRAMLSNGVNSYNDLLECPKFKTKTRNRQDKLSKLGI